MSEKKTKKELQLTDSLFDAHLKWLAAQAPHLLLAVLNWILACHYTGNEEVKATSPEKIRKMAAGLLRERRLDFVITVTDPQGEQVFLLECQSWWDPDILRRIVEYTSVAALAEVVQSEPIQVVLPRRGLLYTAAAARLLTVLLIVERGSAYGG
ncbi:MAG: hypothetical protein HDQ87_02240 [Clostridia bacterium]|nr:hypothetical protein [Clostridia bacterium]